MSERNKTIEKHYQENYERLVNTTAKKFGGNYTNAEDAVSEAYVRSLKYYHCFNPMIQAFENWFSTILKNCVKDIKKDIKTKGAVEYSSNTPDVDMDSLRSQEDLKMDLHRFIIKNYDGKKLEVLNLFYFRNLKTKEISMLMDNLSDNAVRKIIWNFRNEFKKHYNNSLRKRKIFLQ